MSIQSPTNKRAVDMSRELIEKVIHTYNKPIDSCETPSSRNRQLTFDFNNRVNNNSRHHCTTAKLAVKGKVVWDVKSWNPWSLRVEAPEFRKHTEFFKTELRQETNRGNEVSVSISAISQKRNRRRKGLRTRITCNWLITKQRLHLTGVDLLS